jgi:hypothetical protein
MCDVVQDVSSSERPQAAQLGDTFSNCSLHLTRFAVTHTTSNMSQLTLLRLMNTALSGVSSSAKQSAVSVT